MATPARPPAAAPDPAALAALGPVLCLHDARDPNPLSGWRRAARAHACIRIDPDGPSEAICFEDATGRPCWQLLRLPDSDFLAWDRLLDRLAQAPPPSFASRLASAFGRQLRIAWRPCVLRLHVVPASIDGPALAAAEVAVSRVGRECAERLERRFGRPAPIAAGGAPA